MTKSVKIGYVFRLAIIFTAVCCLISFASLMSGALTDGDFLDEETMTSFQTATTFYNFTLVGTIVCIVLSCVAQSFCMKLSVVARTVLIGLETVLLFVGFKVNSVLSFSAKVIKKVGDMDNYSDEELADLMNVSEDKIEEIVEFLKTDPKIEPFLVALLFGVAVFGILSFTSIHWLVKKKTEKMTYEQAFN